MGSVGDNVIRQCFFESGKDRERNDERCRAECYTTDRDPRNERYEASPRLRRVILA